MLLELLRLLQAYRRTILINSSTPVVDHGAASTRQAPVLRLRLMVTTDTLPTLLTLLTTLPMPQDMLMAIHMPRLTRPMLHLILVVRTMKVIKVS